MITPDSKRKIASGGFFFLPIMLVLATAKFLGPSTAEVVTAAPVEYGPSLAGAGSTTHTTPEQDAAVEHIAMLAETTYGQSPLYMRPERTEDGTPTITRPVAVEGMPEFELKAVLASPSGNIAVVDGTLYRVGDEIDGTGWIIDSIDARLRSVAIRHSTSDRTATIAVESSVD